MNKAPNEAGVLAAEIRARLVDPGGATVVVCPPSIALGTVSRVLDGSRIAVGAQNVHSEGRGAFTGEISAEMAREFVDFVIVGHSERRAQFGESDEFINAKVAAATNAGLRPILCVGEPLDVRDSGNAYEFVANQLIQGLSGISDVSRLAVAYEPVWAIGTGQAATAVTAQETLGTIRTTLRERFGAAADDVPCLYGGSVTGANIAEFVQQPDIDGALVGGASLAADSFAEIVLRATEARIQ